MPDKGILYIVPTPTKNFDDMTFRAVNILNKVNLIGAEDLPLAEKLITYHNIKTPVMAYPWFNEDSPIEQFIEKLENGKNIAILSDSESNEISEVASVVVNVALDKSIKVIALPGSTTFVPAQDTSGLITTRFYTEEKKQKTATGKVAEDLSNVLEDLKLNGLYKHERIITTPQGAEISVSTGEKVLNFCANNYLGLANNSDVINSAKEAMDKWGYGLSSVRFICGTQEIHKDLERKMSEFLGTEDTILYVACFDANGGVFEPFLDKDCAIISDELNHASIIDGVRLCKASRYRYKHSDMDDLERCLQESKEAKYRLIATDGVFSMDGDIAKLKEICDLSDKYDALVMVDDSHATGYIGKTGRGTAEHCGVLGRVDIITTTFGKALGGASGGCTSGRKEIIEMLRQRSRPYLFSNTLPPMIAGATIKVLDILSKSSDLPAKTMANANYFRKQMIEAGFDIVPGDTAIVPVMIYNEPKALKMADMLLKEGIYVIGFAFPVVPRGKARIRVQLSAAHTREDLDKAINAFVKVRKEINLS